MKENPNIILAMEEEEALLSLWRRGLQGLVEGSGYQIITARDLETANLLFKQHQQNIAVVFVDGKIPTSPQNPRPTTSVGWIKEICSKGFPGDKLVATSSHPDLLAKLMDAGCGHRCEKHEVVEKIISHVVKVS